MDILKNRNERKAFCLSKNAYKKAKTLAKRANTPFACYLTLQVMKFLQKEASQNLFVWHKMQELEKRAQRKQEARQQKKEQK